jgi:hypothetical protein
MRKLVAGAFVTLDGVMQAPGDPNARTAKAASGTAAGWCPTSTRSLAKS